MTNFDQQKEWQNTPTVVPNGTTVGVPPSEFNFDKHFKRRLYVEEFVEDVDYVQCKVCLKTGQDVRKRRLVDHLKSEHNLTVEEYQATFPGAKVRLKKTLKKRIATTQKKYGVDNVFQAEEIKEKSRETMIEKYGVEHNNHIQESRQKRARTNMARYGSTNPFGSREIQEKIRQTNIEKYGVENPNQSPEVMAQRIETNRERYGVDHYLQTEEFKEKYRQSSLDRFGTEHPMQSEEGKELCFQALREKYGVDNPLLVPEIWQKTYETNLQNHGGKHSQQCPEVLEKAKKTWLEKYGVDNPSKSEEVKERIKQVWLGNYGVPFPPQSLWVNRTQSFPNKLEQAFDDLTPACVVYAGDGSYWVECEGTTKTRNPDFVVLKADQLKAYQSGVSLNDLRISACIECFGDYWHGPKFTGKNREAHKHEVVNYYARAGIACLVLWEHEIKKHPKRVAERVQRFLNKWRRGAYKNKNVPSTTLFDFLSTEHQ